MTHPQVFGQKFTPIRRFSAWKTHPFWPHIPNMTQYGSAPGGSPDLIINNLHKHYTGFAIEFKNPKGMASHDQSKMLQQYQNNGFKTLVSNDYDYIIEQLIEYFRDVRIKCSYCARKLISSLSIKSHIKSFHKTT